MSPYPVLLAVLTGLLALPALGLELDFPGPARVTASRAEPLGSYLLPLGPWREGEIPTRRAEGLVEQTVWTVDAPGLSTLELLAPLRSQLEAQGFAVIWECDTTNCGGFDFRYTTEVLPEPDMHVDLGEFRFLSAVNTGSGESASLMVSRSASQGYVQLIRVDPAGEAAAPPPMTQAVAADPPAAASGGSLAETLETGGSVALDDLAFATGSARLETGRFASLTALADYLAAHAEGVVTLVGHTDASGDLAGNIALSKARAASVRDRLVADYGAPAARIRAEGAGYLAPRASNLTPEGRARNRRVEAMLMPPR